MYFWFGQAKNKRDYLKGLPEGYELTRASSAVNSPPMYLRYRGMTAFRVKIFLLDDIGCLVGCNVCI